MIRRIGALFCALAMVLTAAVLCEIGHFAPLAAAEEQDSLLQIEIIAVPAELVEPGDVTLNFTLTNPSDVDAQNVYLSSADGLLSEPVGRIAAGESQSFSRTHSVTEAELSAGAILYTISHDDPAEPDGKVNASAQAEIRRSDMQPQAEFTRQFSSRTIAAGGTVTITYRIRNTGNVALTSLLVEDALGNYNGRIDRLNVGEARTLISRVTLSETDVSSAKLSYNVEALDDQRFSQSLQDRAISIGQGSLSATLAANYSAFSSNTADVVLLLQNSGNVAYRNVRVVDALYGGVIADEIIVPPSADPVEISCTYPIRSADGFCWRISGVSETGEAVEITTETIQLDARQPGSPAALTLDVRTDTPRIRRAGRVKLLATIENLGEQDAYDLVLTEAKLGELHRFAVIPAGGTIQKELTLDVQQAGSYSFFLHYNAAEDQPEIAECLPLEIVIAADGVLPEGTQNRFFEFTGTSIKIGGSSLFAVLLIVGSAVLLVLIAILLIASRRARIEKRIRLVVERQKRQEENKARKTGLRKNKKQA